MKNLIKALIIAGLAFNAFAFSGCEKKTDTDDAKDAVENAASNAKDATSDAADAVENATK